MIKKCCFLKKMLSLVLVAALILTTPVPVFADEPEQKPVTDEDKDAAIENFSNAAEYLSWHSNVYQEMSNMLSRFGGLNSLSGCILMLQMSGLIVHPDSGKISDLEHEIFDYTDSIEGYDEETGILAEKLVGTATSAAEKARQNKALDYFKKWHAFYQNHMSLISAYKDEYLSEFYSFLLEWWEDEEHDDQWIMYHEDKNGDYVQTYVLDSDFDEPADFPSEADNGESVNPDYCIGIPGDIIPYTADMIFDEDTWMEDFIEAAAENIYDAAEDEDLYVSDEFYYYWYQLDADEKIDFAEELARNLLNSIVYEINSDLMIENEFVDDIMEDFTKYCNELTKNDMSIDALIKAMCMTHAFEGEISWYIDYLIDIMIGMTGYYGQMVLAAAGQDMVHEDDSKAEIRDLWIKSINYLYYLRDNVLTGHYNYCYITNSFLKLNKCNIASDIQLDYEIKENHSKLSQVNHSAWYIADKENNKLDLSRFKILDDEDADMLIHQFQASDNAKEINFAMYMASHGVVEKKDDANSRRIVADEFNGSVMTKFSGTKTFEFSDGLQMKAKNYMGSAFSDNETYVINNETNAKNNFFNAHDKAVASFLNFATEERVADVTAAAKAMYTEDHFYWADDEADTFAFDADRKIKIRQEDNKVSVNETLYKPVYVVELTDEPELIDEAEMIRPQSLPVSSENTEAGATGADWTKYNQERVYQYEDNEKLSQGIGIRIDQAIENATASGITVSLSDAEKTELAGQMKNKLIEVQTMARANKSIVYTDIFGINGNEEKEMALAKAVLPKRYLDEEGNLIVRPENMDTTVLYDPAVVLNFVKTENGVEKTINAAFEVKPSLVIWDTDTNAFYTYEISDKVIADQGLTMALRLCAVSSGNGEGRKVVQYDTSGNCLEKLNEEILSVGGSSATDLYVVLNAKRGGIFELSNVKVEPVTVIPQPVVESPAPEPVVDVEQEKIDENKNIILADTIAKGKKSLQIKWTKVSDAEGYDIFFARCNHDDREIALKVIKTINGNEELTWTLKGLKKNKAYRTYVRAWKMKNGKKKYICRSFTCHTFTSGGNSIYSNSQSVKAKKTEVSLEKGKTYTIKAKVSKLIKNKKLIHKNHAAKFRYVSNDKTIAKVNSKGVIKAMAQGECKVYVVAANGARDLIKVTVK